MSRTFNTRDLGLAIMAHLEGREVSRWHEDTAGDLTEDREAGDVVEIVDASDPNNLHVTLGNGERFIVRIVAD